MRLHKHGNLFATRLKAMIPPVGSKTSEDDATKKALALCDVCVTQTED